MPRPSYHETLVEEFHLAFGAPVSYTPVIPPEDRRKLRLKLILEEFLEFVEASGFDLTVNGDSIKGQRLGLQPGPIPDLISAADGLADLRYVIDGSNLEWGFPGKRILREVHRSNMSKLGEDGKPIYRADGKVLKGPNFTLPDIASILQLYGDLPK